MKTWILTITCLLTLIISAGVTAQENAVKTANYFLLSGTHLDDQAIVETLALYDLIVLPAEAQVWNPHFSETIRNLNPDIILLAYVPSVSWNTIWEDRLHSDLYKGITSDWWLRTQDGDYVSIWPGTQALELTSDWNEYLATFVAEEILVDDYWDGVFYDEVNDSISWVGDLQLASNSSDIDAAWVDAYTQLFADTRARVGTDKIIISNGSSDLQHAPYVNGRMFESFPTPWEGNGSWQTNITNYFSLENHVAHEPVLLINSDTDNTGNQNDYQRVRFGLSSALLGNGFFGFDFGTQSHQQLWRYDEYEAFLGLAKNAAMQDDGIWTRDFTNGKVVTNPTDETKTIRLGGEFEKLHGTQDPITNDGSIVSRVTLSPRDGILLLRPIEEMLNAVFLNGAFARVFDAQGDVKRTGFFSYNSNVLGGLQVVSTDLTSDGIPETITADDSQVFIYNSDGSLHASFYPYTSNYGNGINISVGDLEGDGSVEIVTGTENGGGAHVRIFNSDGVLINPGFFAYDEVYRGGVNVSIGDLNGDGSLEIISGAGVGGGPHVRVFNKQGQLINPGFFAYSESFRGGVNVAVADINGDGVGEIVTGPGLGGSPEIRVYDKDGILLREPFLAVDTDDRTGIEVSAADLDGDGVDEIVTFTQDVFTLSGLGF